MKRLFLLASMVLASAAPALARQVDWSKPQIMDAPPRGKAPATVPEDKPKPVEVYTTQDLLAAGSPTVKEFVRSLEIRESTQKPDKPAPDAPAQQH